ncbi:hydantoinase/oxoprolinase family protein [Enterovirga rhinocerotis]|uniref:N-methylhydantoinase A n=1 Tax=Enterovirga rhinocerotis TaxID=1339210 RepID=A0A4R7C4H5_9HYPH|nr:hydantoinase/oxoprolinase family protein [Enterovirga rhinocerotis]TDR92913.1 N-methylhydantoinase A [Enterovirga rhinocerotis]
MTYELSADVGGTFTDLVLRSDGAQIDIFKASTTPANIADGILNGIAGIAKSLDLDTATFLGRCDSFAVGTTIATNAILEGKQAKTGLLCTDGFRDTLLIREGGKADSYDFYVDYPPPYIPRRLTLGVRERVNAEGGVEIALDEADARRAIRRLKEYGVEAVAVSLLWSIVNPDHELRIGALIEEEMPGVPYSLGHQVNPSIREYRRTSAVAIDASLKPLVQKRIGEISERLAASGFKGVLTFIASSGGRTSPAEIVSRPISLCLSGPSAAPQAGCRLSRQEGVTKGNVLTTDMGGTSFEVSVSVDWKTPMHREGMIGDHMFGIPSVEVKTIGAGGGSIARVDAGGFIHVGPESAGAMPGPACYGRGGTRPTVTDANLVRGLLLPGHFAGGQIELDVGAAERAIAEHVATPLGLGLMEAAELVCLVAEQNMIAAIQDITIRRGVDPRQFVLVSGGAAGGLHAGTIARELGIAQVLIPRAAGVLSAYGIMTGEIKMGFARSLFTSSERFDYEGVNTILAGLRQEGVAFLDRMAVEPSKRVLRYSVEARYAGQVWQISLAFEKDRIEPADLPGLVESFHQLHETFYAVRSPGERVEFTEWSLDAVGTASEGGLESASLSAADASGALLTTSRAWLKDAGGEIDLPVYDGSRLRPGNVIEGPALVQEIVTANFIPFGAQGRVTEQRGLMLTLPIDEAKRLAA